jgi:hypothetical protein
VPTLEQIRHVIQTMPATTEIERRDRALIAFTILTGARDGPIATFKLRHIDIVEGTIDQDARDVWTKFAKSFVTTFFPVGDDIRVAVVDWVNYLRQYKLWRQHDPLFPMTKVAISADLRFAAAGLDRRHWSSAGPIRTIFKEALPRQACRTSTRIASGRHWPCWGSGCTAKPSRHQSRLGVNRVG